MDDARNICPQSLRGSLGIDNIKKGVYCSPNSKSSRHDLEFFFSSKSRSFKTTERCYNSTLGIIKPHAIKENHMGDIVSMINNAGFEITAMKIINMDRECSEQFLEIYKGVVKEYNQMALEMANGQALAMEIVATDPNVNVYEAFRCLCGPNDPVSILFII